MSVYSIIDENPIPDMTFEGFDSSIFGFSCNLSFLRNQEGFDLIRVVCEDGECLSVLFSVPRGNGRSELYLLARAGLSAETTSNVHHHHITALTADANAYADALGVSEFYIRTTQLRAQFLSTRFPEWVATETGNLSEATLEVL